MGKKEREKGKRKVGKGRKIEERDEISNVSVMSKQHITRGVQPVFENQCTSPRADHSSESTSLAATSSQPIVLRLKFPNKTQALCIGTFLLHQVVVYML
jgi:hypothetical protein